MMRATRTSLARDVCLILAKGGHDLDRLAGAFETYGLVERENLSVRPTPRPVSPLLRQIGTGMEESALRTGVPMEACCCCSKVRD